MNCVYSAKVQGQEEADCCIIIRLLLVSAFANVRHIARIELSEPFVTVTVVQKSDFVLNLVTDPKWDCKFCISEIEVSGNVWVTTNTRNHALRGMEAPKALTVINWIMLEGSSLVSQLRSWTKPYQNMSRIAIFADLRTLKIDGPRSLDPNFFAHWLHLGPIGDAQPSDCLL